MLSLAAVNAEAPETPASAFPGGLRAFLVRAVAGASAVHLVGMLFAFLVGVQLARGLGVEGYGQYGIAMAAIALASIPGEFGLPRLVTREVAASSAKADLPRLYGVIRWADRTALTLSLSAAALLAIGALFFVRDNGSSVAWAVLIGVPMVPLVALLKIRGGALQGLAFVVRGQLPSELLRPLLFSVLLFALFTFMPSASAVEAMALNVVTALAGLAVALTWFRPRLPKPKPVTLTQDGRSWFGSALPIALIDGLRVLQPQLVILLLGLMLTADDVGLYRVAAAMAIMVAVPMTLVGSVVTPLWARLHAESDRRRMQLLSTRSAQLMTAGVLVLSLPVILFGREIIGLLFGAEYRPAYPALAVLCVGQLVQACFSPNGGLLLMTGHERRVTRATLLSLLSCVAMLFILVPRFGMLGAALATSFAMLVWNLLCWRDARRRLGIDTSVLGTLQRG